MRANRGLCTLAAAIAAVSLAGCVHRWNYDEGARIDQVLACNGDELLERDVAGAPDLESEDRVASGEERRTRPEGKRAKKAPAGKKKRSARAGAMEVGMR